MEILSQDWIPLLLVGLATLFLVGEVLINARGIFALLGIVFISIYFSVYLETNSLIIMLAVYFIGIILIVIDGKFINDGALSTIGVVSMIISVGLSSPNFVSGTYAVLGVLLGLCFSFLLLRVFKRRRGMWTKLILRYQLSSEEGYNSINEDYKDLINQEGITLNDLRPVGDIRIGEKKFSVISNGEWIPKGTSIIVKQVDGTRILVEEVNKGNPDFS